MFCRNCGKSAEENALFCTGCGARLSGPDTDTIAATVTEVIEKPVEAAEIQQQPQQTQPEQQVQQILPEEKAQPEQQAQPFAGENPPPVMPEIRYIEPLPEKPKTFFGTGALVFCLVIIGLLSISTGVFAGLFFSLLK
ncbi:MAG: zinc ribbon domain-containing protein [Ruminiclostridium sp.]